MNRPGNIPKGAFEEFERQLLREELQEEEYALRLRLQMQNEQHALIMSAEDEYKQTGDINALILFWDTIWENGGLLFNGSRWTFRLPDLYISIGQYDDALKIVRKIKNPNYKAKKQGYIDKIKLLKTHSTKV